MDTKRFCVLNEDGNTFVFAERGDSKVHYEKHLVCRTGTGMLDQIMNLIQTGPSIRYFETVGT